MDLLIMQFSLTKMLFLKYIFLSNIFCFFKYEPKDANFHDDHEEMCMNNSVMIKYNLISSLLCLDLQIVPSQKMFQRNIYVFTVLFRSKR
jgi:hypothetical protein